MSKDKGSKNVKKPAATGPKKPGSDYQAGKTSVSNADLKPTKKK